MLTMKNREGQQIYEFDEKTKAQVAQLWKERTQGRYKTDREGFTKAFLSLSENATYDKSKPISGSVAQQQEHSEKILREMTEERALMAQELSEQLALRVKEHMFLKERKNSDFVRRRRSEANIFESQVQSQENAARTLEDKLVQMEDQKKQNEEAGFDKQAYHMLKAEIKKRREAKERLLQQGFPQLKPYASI